VVDRIYVLNRLRHPLGVEQVELVARRRTNLVILGLKQRQKRSAEHSGSTCHEH
jgi:hypothetical protein